MYRFLFIAMVVFAITGCSDKFTNPKGVVCYDDGMCQVADPFDANINNIDKCLNSEIPLIIKNYEGESFFVRGEGTVDFDNGELKTASVVSLYFKEMVNVYQEMYKTDISKEIKEIAVYDEEIYSTPNEYISKILLSANISGINKFAPTEVNGGAVKCYYFNVNSFVRKKLSHLMPKSFNDNIKKILAETSKRTRVKINDKKAEYKSEKFAKVNVSIGVEQQFVANPTLEEKEKVKEKILSKKEEDDFASFCQTSFTYNIKEIECNEKSIEEITPNDVYELKKIPSLIYLDLVGTTITSVKLLKQIKTLKALRIVTDNIVDKTELDLLKKDNPNLVIVSVAKTDENTSMTKYQKLKQFFETLPVLAIDNEEQTNWIQLFEAKNWDELMKIFNEKNLFVFEKAAKFNKAIYPELDKYLAGEEVKDIEIFYETANLINIKFIEIHRDYLNSIKFKIDFTKLKKSIEEKKYETVCQDIEALKLIDAKNKDLIDLSKNLLTEANKLFTEGTKLEAKEHLKAYENYKTVLLMCPDKTLLNKVNPKIKALKTKYKLE